MMIGEPSRSRYGRAIDALEVIGFRPLLALELTARVTPASPLATGRVVLRWRRRGAGWAATETIERGDVQGALERCGGRALGWVQARREGCGDEDRYAVPEDGL